MKRSSSTAELTNEQLVKEARRPKRKVAVLIGYCGTGYHGMQVNPPHKTIEGDLFKAFCEAGAISKDNADDPKKSSFIRAARTDKGVHAAGNVVSLKLIIEDPNIVEKINAHLPDQIRVWGFSRTNKSFECRKCCSSRIYEYILPTYTLMGPKKSTALGRRISELATKVQIPELDAEYAEFWSGVDQALTEAGFTPEEVATLEAREDENTEDRERLRQLKAVENTHRRAYRAVPERIKRLRDALKQYEGVHDFHNFTVGKTFGEPSATRIMKSLVVSDPKIINGTEWVSIKIHGQSFMLHQIRKMIAMATLTVRTGVRVERIAGLFEDFKLGVPKAPALGLLLEQPVYDGYNHRLAQLGHPQITFEPYMEEMEAFKHKHIYDKIYAQEAKENEFHAFFAYIDTYRSSELLDYLCDNKRPDPNSKASSQTDKKLLDEEDEQANEDNEG